MLFSDAVEHYTQIHNSKLLPFTHKIVGASKSFNFYCDVWDYASRQEQFFWFPPLLLQVNNSLHHLMPPLCCCAHCCQLSVSHCWITHWLHHRQGREYEREMLRQQCHACQLPFHLFCELASSELSLEMLALRIVSSWAHQQGPSILSSGNILPGP